jgi:hypothetical protein
MAESCRQDVGDSASPRTLTDTLALVRVRAPLFDEALRKLA